LLESALARPFQTFNGADLYPESIEKAAALIQSLLNNHPFVDGNKRIGYVIMRLFIIESGNDIIATQNEKYDFVIKIASGELDFNGICTWIRTKINEKSLDK
jgi:death-on-curing protein